MPTYEYECEKCGYQFDMFQNMTDEPVKTCPKCDGAVVRLIGAGSGIIFKGSGFYQTDYKNKKTARDKDAPACPKPSDACKNCPASQEGK